ncbi:MAG TPA: hypothetical protein PLE74_13245 [Candidatus Cloacimonadota bacterium]|nr:hypothetical protein [Candidatus Cloacimonadota bacterium]
MKNVLFLFAIIFILFGCAQKPVDEGEYKGCEEYIQSYASDNIGPDWFAKDKPAGKIEVNEVKVLKVLPIKEDANNAVVTAVLKGVSYNADNESVAKKFSMRKEFKVTIVPSGFAVKPLTSIEK